MKLHDLFGEKIIFFCCSLAIAFTVIAHSPSFAREEAISCMDNANTNADVNDCGNRIVKPREAMVDNQFERLSKKHEGNDKVQTMLQLTRRGWDNYKNLQCALESVLAATNQVDGPDSVEANRAFLRCMVRTLDEMESALKKF
ncbi:MAG: lysozyme inhibitor LprI family protein [Syntrophobacteraceae bacterium]